MKILSKKPGPKPKANVTPKTAVRRLQRHYRRNGMTLRKTKPADVPSLGKYHVVDLGLNAVVKKNVNIDEEAASITADSKRPTTMTKAYESQIRVPDSDLSWAITHLADEAHAAGPDLYGSPNVFRAVTGLIHALRQVGMVR